MMWGREHLAKKTPNRENIFSTLTQIGCTQRRGTCSNDKRFRGILTGIFDLQLVRAVMSIRCQSSARLYQAADSADHFTPDCTSPLRNYKGPSDVIIIASARQCALQMRSRCAVYMGHGILLFCSNMHGKCNYPFFRVIVPTNITRL